MVLASRPSGAPDDLRGYRRLASATTVLTLVLIAIGGTVRATDSGLACPDWPRCFGLWIPPADFHIWVEHTHRLVAGVVALMVLALVVWGLARFRDRPWLVVPAVVALVLVLVQAGLGALVVLHLLRAGLVTAHLGMAMVVLGCLLLIVVRSAVPAPAERGARDLRFAWVATAIAALAFVQILVGGHVTGIGAGLVWTDFPLMGGRVVPDLGTERELYHFAHRALGFGVLAAAIGLCAAAIRHRRRLEGKGGWTPVHRWLVKLPMWGATLVVVQIGLGVANLWTRTSALTVVPHLAVASWIWSVLVLTAILAFRLAPVRTEVTADAETQTEAEVGA